MSREKLLFVDIQAVGSLSSGFPMEIAWKSPDSFVHRFFFRIENPEIPDRVKRLTGIKPGDLTGSSAVPVEEIKQLFLAAVGLPDSPRTLIAHHAVYEKRWLDHITGLDLSFTCTGVMARNTIENLRSGSLRAVAGVTGHVMGKSRRATEHVLATEAVYFALIHGFSHEPVAKETRLAMPEAPGTYRFLDPGGNVLYVGKAKNLKNRVNSHFTGKASGRRGEMLSRVFRIEYEKAETAFHAAVAESEFISSLSPEYNRAGKILDHRLWYLSGDMTRVLENPDEIGCFGPFTGRGVVEDFAYLLSTINSVLNKMTIVENLFGDVPISLFEEVLPVWKKPVLQAGILQYGKDAFCRARAEEETDEKPLQEVVNKEYVEKRLDGIIIYGCLLCRRSAALKILSGCVISWSSSQSSEIVHNFVDNSTSEPWSQGKVRKLMVVLGELKRVYRSGYHPELITGTGRVLSGDRLGFLLDLL